MIVSTPRGALQSGVPIERRLTALQAHLDLTCGRIAALAEEMRPFLAPTDPVVFSPAEHCPVGGKVIAGTGHVLCSASCDALLRTCFIGQSDLTRRLAGRSGGSRPEPYLPDSAKSFTPIRSEASGLGRKDPHPRFSVPADNTIFRPGRTCGDPTPKPKEDN